MQGQCQLVNYMNLLMFLTQECAPWHAARQKRTRHMEKNAAPALLRRIANDEAGRITARP
jgi:hypothetical protein